MTYLLTLGIIIYSFIFVSAQKEKISYSMIRDKMILLAYKIAKEYRLDEIAYVNITVTALRRQFKSITENHYSFNVD